MVESEPAGELAVLRQNVKGLPVLVAAHAVLLRQRRQCPLLVADHCQQRRTRAVVVKPAQPAQFVGEVVEDGLPRSILCAWPKMSATSLDVGWVPTTNGIDQPGAGQIAQPAWFGDCDAGSEQLVKLARCPSRGTLSTEGERNVSPEKIGRRVHGGKTQDMGLRPGSKTPIDVGKLHSRFEAPSYIILGQV